MERLESYVASELLQRIRRAAGDDRAGACISFRGATLFVDISDYTGLAESLCSNGSTGVEQLGEILDRVFRSHVGAVHESGGEIAYFAGDAFLAYWAADDDDLARALRRAEDCARLLHLTPWLEPHALPHAPMLHIGAGAGDLWGARLGVGPGWHVLLAGAAVRQACAASRRAAAGETVVAPGGESVRARSCAESTAGPTAAGSVLPDRVAAQRPSGSVLLDPLEIAAQVPKRVQEFAGDGYAAWIPQRRTMSALFVRIDGLDETSRDALGRYQAVATSIGVALRPYAGSSGQLRLDDKGLVFTLCLGVPNDAHADDALRAVRAGLAIGGELSRLGVGCAMGVAAGDGVCMPVGGPQRRLYWTGGRFKHVGARLMEAAGSGLLCTERVADRVRHAVSLSPERPLTL
jgi:class 3 adenylate cyclase